MRARLRIVCFWRPQSADIVPGKGATFTGIKPAGIDYGPMIPAAEQATASGDLQAIKAVVLKEIDYLLGERLAHLRKLRQVSSEPTDHSPGSRCARAHKRRTWLHHVAEGIHQALLGKGPAHHED